MWSKNFTQQRTSLLRSRKAQESIVETVIHVVIGLVVVLAILFLGAQVYKLTQPTQGSKVSFDRIVQGVNNLLNAPNVSLCYVTVSFDDHEALVGFNQNQAWATRSAFLHTVELSRPIKQCPTAESCLALCNVGRYTADDDCTDSYLYDAASYENVVRFEYLLEFEDPVPLLYYGSDGTAERFVLKKQGEINASVIQIQNTAKDLGTEIRPCEIYANVPGTMNVTTFS